MAQLGLITPVAAERLEGGVLLEDGCKSPGLVNANAVPEEICRRYGPHILRIIANNSS